ncbi:GntR family transcriptional regulator [Azospirillum canadense]|uniref:GntR family transcriptional regulator n=1 Tax=Azospirillum canadense TaxID=403962 RepID=UPI002227E42B|nr:GntR family transcriptional regulator [Azospirillum canadense]MCW2241153.1 DNA-binding GntR family transcriptional regulator [Azospirillum canadense]
MLSTDSAATAADQPRGMTVDFVVEKLRQGIMEGRFVPGQRLIARDLTDDIGISRGPLREAFRRLAAEGLVDLIPNRGATIRRLSRKQIRDLFRIRETLEGLAARLAAERIGEGDHRRVFTEVWEQVRPTGRELPWRVFIERNRLYHRTIVAIGGNDQLMELIQQLQLPLVMLQIGQAMPMENAELSHQDHIHVAEAILAGDPDRAEAAMRTHLRRSHDWIVTLPDSAFRSD